MWLRRRASRLGVSIAYPGILGIPDDKPVTFKGEIVTYNGETVYYKDSGEVVRP